MIIYKTVCVGCGRCQPFCPSGAIHFEDMKSVVDQDVCYECGNCLRVEVCPVDAIAESPHVYEMPRALRKYFSDPNATHQATGIQGRGTEESKTNDVTLRCGPRRRRSPRTSGGLPCARTVPGTRRRPTANRRAR